MNKIVLSVSAVALALVMGVTLAGAQTTVTTTSTTSTAVFTRDLTIGSTGADVSALQAILIANGKLMIAAPTGYFGAMTKAALASWQASVGITPAAGYFGPISKAYLASHSSGTTTTTSTVAGCAAGAAFSSTTGAPCTTTTTTTSGSLGGGEASLESFDLSSGDDDEVEEGASAEIAEIEFDVEDADVELNRVDLSLVADGDNEEEDPWDTFDSLRLLIDGNEIGEIDLSDEDEYLDEDDGTFRLSNLDYVIDEGETVKIVVEVTAQNSVDGADADAATWTINVETDGIRATDAEGIEQYIGTAADEVEFDVVVEGDGEELNVSTSSDDPETETYQVYDDEKSDFHSIFAFDIEAEESDVEFDTVTLRVTTSATTSTMVDDFVLEIDGEEFDDWSYVGTPAAGSSTVSVEFDIDGDYTLDADSEVTAVLKAKFKAANGTNYSSSSTNTILARILDGGIEGEGADDIDSDGNVTGDTHTLSVAGLMVELVSKAADSTGTDDTVGEFEFVVDVTSFEEDAFVELSADRGTTTSGAGFSIFILDGNNNAVYTGTTTYSIEADEDEDNNNFVEVSEDDTVRFTVTVFYDALTEGSYKAVLHAVNFNDTAANEDTEKELSPESDYRTSSTYVEI